MLLSPDLKQEELIPYTTTHVTIESIACCRNDLKTSKTDYLLVSSLLDDYLEEEKKSTTFLPSQLKNVYEEEKGGDTTLIMKCKFDTDAKKFTC